MWGGGPPRGRAGCAEAAPCPAHHHVVWEVIWGVDTAAAESPSGCVWGSVAAEEEGEMKACPPRTGTCARQLRIDPGPAVYP